MRFAATTLAAAVAAAAVISPAPAVEARGIFGLSARRAGNSFGLQNLDPRGDVTSFPLSIPRGGSPAVVGETDEDRPVEETLYLPGLLDATLAKKTVSSDLVALLAGGHNFFYVSK